MVGSERYRLVNANHYCRTTTPDEEVTALVTDGKKTDTSSPATTKSSKFTPGVNVGVVAKTPLLPTSLTNAGRMISLVELDGGPHREMAVDVPEGFMARTKTPPRYPPPKSSVSTGKKNGGVSKPPPPPREVSSSSKAQPSSTKPAQRSSISSSKTSAAASPAPSSGAGSISRHRLATGSVTTTSGQSSDQIDASITSPAPNHDQMERIKKYQVSPSSMPM